MRCPAWASAALLLFVACSPIFSQTITDNNAHSWFMYFGDHPVSDRWGIHLEGQARRTSYVNAWQQYMFRPGVNYKFTPNIMGTVGYAFAESYPYGDLPSAKRSFPEHRYWEQLLVRNKLGQLTFQNRLRLEQRMVGTYSSADGPVADWQFRQRFRYMLRGDIPLPNKRLYIGLYDEVFLNFGANRGNRALDQNRAYGALGVKLSKFEKFELGYMHQYVPQRNGLVVEHNHTLQFALFSSRPFRESGD